VELFAYLERELEDPRQPKGVRHPVSAIVKAVLVALLAGKINVSQIAKYISVVWDDLNEELGFWHWHAPDEATYRRVLSALKPDCLSRAFQAWLADLLAC